MQDFILSVFDYYKDKSIGDLSDNDKLDIIVSVLVDNNNPETFPLSFIMQNNHCIRCGKCCEFIGCEQLFENTCLIWDKRYEQCKNYPYFHSEEKSGLDLNNDCNYAFWIAVKRLRMIFDDIIQNNNDRTEDKEREKK